MAEWPTSEVFVLINSEEEPHVQPGAGDGNLFFLIRFVLVTWESYKFIFN